MLGVDDARGCSRLEWWNADSVNYAVCPCSVNVLSHGTARHGAVRRRWCGVNATLLVVHV